MDTQEGTLLDSPYLKSFAVTFPKIAALNRRIGMSNSTKKVRKPRAPTGNRIK